MEKFDLIVIGAGPAGYPLAIKMAKNGVKTALVVQNDDFGGTCTNRGCIPTKVLLTPVSHLNMLKNCDSFGLECSNIKNDWAKTLEKKNQISLKMRDNVKQLLIKNSVVIFSGFGRLFKGRIVEITNSPNLKTQICADKICLAVGSVPSFPPSFPTNRDIFLSSDEALGLKSVPKSLIIVGGGVIGMELGQVFAAFGSKITVVEMLPQILNGLDSAVARRLTPIFKKSGLEIITKTAVDSLSEKDGKASAIIGGKEQIFEKALICVGRKVNYAFMQGTDVLLERDGAFIKTDSNFETSESGVYAIGDAIKGPMLAHKATYDAMILADNLLGGHRKANYALVPACVFTHPEVAWVGFSEDKLKERGIPYKVGKSLYSANGKAVSMEQTDGQAKVMMGVDGKLLGAVIWGAEASNIINEASIMAQFGITHNDFASVIYPHPTLSEVFYEAIKNAAGEDINN